MAAKKKTAPKRPVNFDALKNDLAQAAAKFNELINQVMSHNKCDDVEVCFDGITIDSVYVYESKDDSLIYSKGN